VQLFDIIKKKLLDTKTLATATKYWKFLDTTRLVLVDQQSLSYWLPFEAKIQQMFAVHSELTDYDIHNVDASSDNDWICIAATKRFSLDVRPPIFSLLNSAHMGAIFFF